MHSLMASGHEEEFLSSLEEHFDLTSRGCFAWWVLNRKAFVLDGACPPEFATRREIEEIERFSLGVIAAHGVSDPRTGGGTYVSFAGVPRDQTEKTLLALDLIAPVLHAQFLASMPRVERSLDISALTGRQRDLVDLAVTGLSDKEIASQLAISENTVGNHFRAIFARLGITKRSELIVSLR